MSKVLTGAALILIVAAAIMAFVRLAPTDPDLWHLPLDPRPAQITTASRDKITALANGAYVDLSVAPDQAQALLAKLDGIALAAPRTIRIAGSAETGRITWQTRSAFWGFPDYTTAESTRAGVTVYARQRFGNHDWGVNAARLAAWISKL